jgi:hypothetical protein
MIIAFYAFMLAIMGGIVLYAIVSRAPTIAGVVVQGWRWWSGLPIDAYLTGALALPAGFPDLWDPWGAGVALVLGIAALVAFARYAPRYIAGSDI